MDVILLIIFSAALLALLFSLFWIQKKKPKPIPSIPIIYRLILAEQVPFYQQLNEDKRQSFESRVQFFLSQVKITGIKTTVEDIDKTLIAASAVIPIFNFPGWEYVNLREVLLYPDSFDHDFQQQGGDRHILGMVGDGPMNHVMILSQHDLRQAFTNKTGKTNTAIHEFVHLVDKTDGSVDGVPEFILEKKYILPWLELIQQEIKKILKDRSDINPYGATNQAEFFAVVSEYFFERPDLLKQKHPELYDLLMIIFGQKAPA